MASESVTVQAFSLMADASLHAGKPKAKGCGLACWHWGLVTNYVDNSGPRHVRLTTRMPEMLGRTSSLTMCLFERGPSKGGYALPYAMKCTRQHSTFQELSRATEASRTWAIVLSPPDLPRLMGLSMPGKGRGLCSFN